MIFQGLCSRHLGNIKANVNGFAFSVKTQLMPSLMGVVFFLIKILKKCPSGRNHGNNSLGNTPLAQSKHHLFKKYKTCHIHKGRQLQERDTFLKF